MPLEEEKPKKLDHKVPDMVSAIVGRIPDLQRPVSSSLMSKEDDDRGARIVTLAGHNIGANLKSEMDEKSGSHYVELDEMSTYVNSNFQAVNNSIMMGGSYTANKPGVHLDVSDFVEHCERDHGKLGKHGKKEKKKEKKEKEEDQESGKSDHRERDHGKPGKHGKKEEDEEDDDDKDDEDQESGKSDHRERDHGKPGKHGKKEEEEEDEEEDQESRKSDRQTKHSD